MKKVIPVIFLLFTSIGFGQTKFQHTTTVSNIRSNSTFLDAKGLNNNPFAIIIAEFAGAKGMAHPHPLGVWYDGSKWAIFNQDMAPMPAGISFNVIWSNPDASAFYKIESKTNNIKGSMVLDNSALNNNPAASFYITQVWNPEGNGGIYNNAEIITEYDQSLARWVVKNQNGTAVAPGAGFNIMITQQDGATGLPPKIPVIVIDPSVETTAQVVNPPIKNPPNTQPNNNPEITIIKDPLSLLAGTSASQANLGFENPFTGNWVATGDAFKNQPVEGHTVSTDRVLTKMQYNNNGIGGDYWKGLTYPIGFRDNKWIGTYENGNGDGPIGTLTSKAFLTSGRYLHFLLGGGNDLNKLYVELQVPKSVYEAAWGAGKSGFFGNTTDGYTIVNRITPLINSEEMYRYYFDLDAELNHQYMNKTVRIRIVDEKSTSWGHINADDFGMTNDLADFISISRDGFRLYADKDKPVWGYFDSHAHPAADEAFGKNYYVGSSNSQLNTTWSNDICTRSHTAGRTLDGFTNVFDPHKFFDGGWPDMWGFPKFNGKMHQKYQVDLIKRAWEGGLNIFCALGMNNMYIATRSLGHASNGEALDDESVLYRQVAVMKEMARANSSWMEIAYTPTDARRIILEKKLCVILGLESDVFGNFKSPDCAWRDRNGDRPLVEITEADASEKLERKLDEYYAMGLRQILPLHYLSKPFGGTAVFNGNTFLPQINFYNSVRVKTGVPDRIGFSLYEDFPTGPALVGDIIAYGDYARRILKQDEGAEISMVNADGLTPVGNILFRKLMKKGFIIDQEHASYQSKRDIFSVSTANNTYPIMSSHATPEGLSFIWKGEPKRFSGRGHEKFENFGTSTIRYVAHEMELNDESYSKISATKGTVGVFALSNHKRKYEGPWGNIANDCPGSTKTMAQMYCYSLEKMGGSGVGLASDLPMVDAVGPRFGPYAAWALTAEDGAVFNNARRRINRLAQTNGVKYDTRAIRHHPEFFEGADIDIFEEDIWKALAAWESNINAVVDENLVSESRDREHRGRIRNMVKGLFFTSQEQLMRWCITCGDAPWEQAAMFCLKNNVQPENLTIYDEGGRRYTRNFYDRILPIWNSWKAKNGNDAQAPLRRLITGNRYWDFNLDGLAHFGLMPDMLQDLKNIGFTHLQFTPLFSSAEDYIKMWEKAEATKHLISD